MFRTCLDQLNAYTAGKPISEIKKAFGFETVFKLNANENPMGPSREAVKAAQEILMHVNDYPDAGAQRLRHTLALLLGVMPEQIFVGNGGDEILRLLTEAIIDPGDEAIAATPYFSLYKNNVQLMNGVMREVQFGDTTFEFDPKAILEAITSRTRLIFLTSPNNPTGTIIRREVLLDFLRQVPKDIFILLDEAYCDYAASDPEYPDGVAYLKSFENLIVLRTFSKAYGLAGLRIGYAVASASIIQTLMKIKLVFNVSLPAQAAALAALQDPGHVQKTLSQNRHVLSELYKFFEKHGLDYVKSYANFVFVNFGCPVDAVVSHLSHEGIFITPGTVWGFDNWGRISTGSDDAMNALMAALDRYYSD